MKALALVALALAVTTTASAAEPRFRYERALTVHSADPYRLLPDEGLRGHAEIDLQDIRIVDRKGAPVAWRFLPVPASLGIPWKVASTSRHERGKRTRLRVDLGVRLPTDTVVVTAATNAYDRPVLVEASLDGKGWWWAHRGRISRFATTRYARLPVESPTVARFFRITIDNGDDRPLTDIRVRVLHAPIALLVAGQGAPPYTVRYGAALSAPDYDFARLPLNALGVSHATDATLGPELRVLASDANIVKPKASMGGYHWLVVVCLALAAIAIAAAGFVVVRRKTSP